MKRTHKISEEKDLLKAFKAAAGDEATLQGFLIDILTPGEYNAVVQRWQIVKRLAKGEQHRAVSDDLRVGIATVTRGSRELRNRDGGFWQVWKKISKK